LSLWFLTEHHAVKAY